MKYDLILLDGRHTLFRTASTMGSLGVDTFDGHMPTGAIYGFIKVCLSIVTNHGTPDCKLVVCWEGGSIRRREMYADYKKQRRNRKDIEENVFLATLNDQEQVLKGMIKLAGWGQAWSYGHEADDVMATLAKRSKVPTAIYTGDHDLHQCVTETVHCLSPNNSRKRKGGPDVITWDLSAVKERWGVPPANVPDIKALEGDGSDNIPGCPKIGKVWARKLLSQTHDVDSIIRKSKADGCLSGEYEGKAWESPKHAQLIKENEEIVRLSYDLAKVVEDVDVTWIEPKMNSKQLVRAFQTFRFASLLRPVVFNNIIQIGGRHANE